MFDTDENKHEVKKKKKKKEKCWLVGPMFFNPPPRIEISEGKKKRIFGMQAIHKILYHS